MAVCSRNLKKILENQIRGIQTSTKNLNKDKIPTSFSTKLDEQKERRKHFPFKEERFIFDASKFRLQVLKSENKNIENVSFQLDPDTNDYIKYNSKSIKNKTFKPKVFDINNLKVDSDYKKPFSEGVLIELFENLNSKKTKINDET